MCVNSLQCSQGLMGTCTNSSMQPSPPPSPPSFPVCTLFSHGRNCKLGCRPHLANQTVLLQRPRHIILLSLRIDQSGISDILYITDYSDLNFPINHTLPIVSALLELSTSRLEFGPRHILILIVYDQFLMNIEMHLIIIVSSRLFHVWSVVLLYGEIKLIKQSKQAKMF